MRKRISILPLQSKPVYTKVRAELASPLVRWIRQHSRFVKITSSLLVVIVIAGAVFMMIQNGKGPADGSADPNPVTTPPVTAPPASSDTVPEKPLPTATVVEEGEQEGRTELSFHFKQPVACRDFNVDELQIVGKDASTLFEVASPELTRVCADETTGEAKADPSGTEIESTENQTDPNTGTTEGEDSSDPAEGEAVQSSESVGDAQENQTYSSQVTVKLDKPLDVPSRKVVVDGVSYELSDESALSEEQTPENETDEGV